MSSTLHTWNILFNRQKGEKSIKDFFQDVVQYVSVVCPRQTVLCEMVAMKSKYRENNLYMLYSKDITEFVP